MRGCRVPLTISPELPRATSIIKKLKVHNRVQLGTKKRRATVKAFWRGSRYDFIEVGSDDVDIRQAAIIWTAEIDVDKLMAIWNSENVTKSHGTEEALKQLIREATGTQRRIHIGGIVVRNLFSLDRKDAGFAPETAPGRLLDSEAKDGWAEDLHLEKSRLYRYSQAGKLGYEVIDFEQVEKVAYLVPRWGLTPKLTKDVEGNPSTWVWETKADISRDIVYVEDRDVYGRHHDLKPGETQDIGYF